MKKMIVCACLLSSALSFAQDEIRKKVKSQMYGPAGCGLGSILIEQKTGPIQILASTLNGTGGQTFAMTSGTSNCGRPLWASRAAEYIHYNRIALDQDVANGGGEAVTQLSKIMECQIQVDQNLSQRYQTLSFESQQFADDAAVLFKQKCFTPAS